MVEDLIDATAIGVMLEARMARDFIESKGLQDEWVKYCVEHFPEVKDFLQMLTNQFAEKKLLKEK